MFYKIKVSGLLRLPRDLRHPPRGDDEGGVRAVAAGFPRAAVERAEVAVAPDGHPRGLDKGPAQPAVALREQPAVMGLIAAAAGRRREARIRDPAMPDNGFGRNRGRNFP